MEILRSDVKKPNLDIRVNDVTVDGDMHYTKKEGDITTITFQNGSTQFFMNFEIITELPLQTKAVRFQKSEFTHTGPGAESWTSTTLFPELADLQSDQRIQLYTRDTIPSTKTALIYINPAGNITFESEASTNPGACTTETTCVILSNSG